MAQPLCQNVPTYCLACLGTNNKFTDEHMLKRWKYIFHKCKKMGIDAVSFGADGDSRELESMRASSHLMASSSNLKLCLHCPPQIGENCHSIRMEQVVCLRRPTYVTYVQDMVNVAVKLK